MVQENGSVTLTDAERFASNLTPKQEAIVLEAQSPELRARLLEAYWAMNATHMEFNKLMVALPDGVGDVWIQQTVRPFTIKHDDLGVYIEPD